MQESDSWGTPALPRRASPPKTPAPAPVPDEPQALAPVAAARRAGAEGAARKKPVAPRATKPSAIPAPMTVVATVPAAAPATRAPARRTARIAPAGALPPANIPREALISPRHDKFLTYALGGSLLVHMVVLMIHFSPFDLRQLTDRGPPIEVALVNAKTAAKPTKADILAQANLDGGGNTDADRRARTPLPVLPMNNPEQQVTVATQKVETLEQQTRELMTQLRSTPVAAVQQKPVDANERTELPTANELMQRTLESMKLEAQIAKDMETYQKRPKRRFVGARAEEYRFARYVEDWRLKIERVGNLNYPMAAREHRLYGSLLLTVSIKSDGSVENIEVNQSSGSRILDAAAVKIVEMSAPFAEFPPDIKRDTDILHVTRTWTFTKADALVSQ
jgi:periplasmic protein TonB